MTCKSSSFGSEPIPELLIKQAFPASIGILVMSLNILIDTIFVGKWIGSNAIAAINVVLPISFFIAALGMAIGIALESFTNVNTPLEFSSLPRTWVAMVVTLAQGLAFSFIELLSSL